jgi:hypothetical protein
MLHTQGFRAFPKHHDNVNKRFIRELIHPERADVANVDEDSHPLVRRTFCNFCRPLSATQTLSALVKAVSRSLFSVQQVLITESDAMVRFPIEQFFALPSASIIRGCFTPPTFCH